MVLTKYKIGDLIQVIDERNSEGIDRFFGININKEFMPTVANTDNLDGSKYKIIRKNRFVYSGMQTGRDKCIRIGLFQEDEPVIVSPAYTTFEVTAKDIVLPEYFFMLFLSKEKDRLGWFLSDSSVRSNLDWDRFCEIELNLPSKEIQQKYVDIFNALQKNINSYKSSIDNLINTFNLYINKLVLEVPKKAIGKYIVQSEEKNNDLVYGLEDVRGISIDKIFIETKAKMKNVSLAPYLIVEPQSFAYVPVTSRNGDKISIAYNDSDGTYIVSSSYMVFKCISDELLPSYLFMFLSRPDFDRFARFNSWGSAREVLNWEDLYRYEIPFPSVEIQKDIVEIFNEYGRRQQIINKLETLQKSRCSVLIKGSLTEA